MVAIIDDSPRHQFEPKTKPRSSLKDSFTRTFSFTKSKTSSLDRPRRGSEEKPSSRPDTLYIDNNAAIGARPKSKSASVLVDIQPWDDRRGRKSDIHDIYDSPDESQSPNSPSVPVALLPKEPDPTIPKHRIFTTPRGLFGFGQSQKSDETHKPKKVIQFVIYKLYLLKISFLCRGHRSREINLLLPLPRMSL